MGELLEANRLSARDSIFIGDGRTDQDAADHHAMRFVGMDNGDSSFDPATAWKVVNNLEELSPLFAQS